MSSTQQHIILTVDNKVVYDSTASNPAASAATTTPNPAAAKIDVKNLKSVSFPKKDEKYYMVTYGATTPTNVSNPEKVTFLSSKSENGPGYGETTYTYMVDTAEKGKVTYTNYAGPNGRGGTEVIFYEIPAVAGGKRRNNRRKSANKGGRRSRRMRRANNRKSSRRF